MLQEYKGNEYLKKGKTEEVVKKCEQLVWQLKTKPQLVKYFRTITRNFQEQEVSDQGINTFQDMERIHK